MSDPLLTADANIKQMQKEIAELRNVVALFMDALVPSRNEARVKRAIEAAKKLP